MERVLVAKLITTMSNLFTPVDKVIKTDINGNEYETYEVRKKLFDYEAAWDIVKAGLRHKVPGTGNRLRLDSEGHNRHEERILNEKY